MTTKSYTDVGIEDHRQPQTVDVERKPNRWRAVRIALRNPPRMMSNPTPRQVCACGSKNTSAYRMCSSLARCRYAHARS